MTAAKTTLLSEDVKMALETIRTHKVRSFLTVLGVVIGVTVAITVTAILLGFETSYEIDCFLKAHGVYEDFTMEDFERDVADLKSLGF